MTSSRPRGVISRLSSRGGTEITNVTLGGQSCKKLRTDLAQAIRVMRTCAWINTLLLVCFAVLASACQDRAGGASPEPHAAANSALQSFLDGKELDAAVAGPQLTAADRTRLVDQVRRIYAGLGYQL